MAVDSKLKILETSLDRLNRRQGPGFMVAGKVVDKDTLHTMYVPDPPPSEPSLFAQTVGRTRRCCRRHEDHLCAVPVKTVPD